MRDIWRAKKRQKKTFTNLHPHSTIFFSFLGLKASVAFKDSKAPTGGLSLETCLPESWSASHLATGEDERRCDDLRVFGESVFHLVGEGERSERRDRAREGTRRKEAVKGRRTEALGGLSRANSDNSAKSEAPLPRGAVLFPHGFPKEHPPRSGQLHQ